MSPNDYIRRLKAVTTQFQFAIADAKAGEIEGSHGHTRITRDRLVALMDEVKALPSETALAQGIGAGRGATNPGRPFYRCTQGHDRCGEMYAGSDYPYCE